MPYFSEGGVLAAEPEAEALLISEAISLAKKLKSKSMQFRQTSELKTDIPVKTDRVAMVLDIDPDPEVILRSFDTKMRSNVRRSCKTGLEAEFGGIEFLDDFYQIFAHRMRDLGTPVYSKKFFEQILKVFPTETFDLQSANYGENCRRVIHDGLQELDRIQLGGRCFPKSKT